MLPMSPPRKFAVLLLPRTLLCVMLAAWSSAVRAGEQGESPVAMAQAIAAAERNLEIGEMQIAESHYRAALFEGWLLLSALAKKTGDLPEARAALERATASAVETRRARIPLAVVLAEMDEPDEAELVLRSLIAEDTTDSEARRLLSKTLAETGRLDESVQELEQLRYLMPGDPENAYLLATAYLKQKRLDAADELLAEIAEAIPTPQTHILIGRTYRDSDLYERARRAFEAALHLDPNVERAHYYLGSVHLLDRGATALEQALPEFELELRVNPGDRMTSLYLGMALVEERRYQDAIPHLEIASRREDIRADALRYLGRCLLETGQTEHAISALRRGLEATATSPEAQSRELPEFQARQISKLHYQLAQALRRDGDRDSADFHFAEAKRHQAQLTESARESLDHYLENETMTYQDLEPPSDPSGRGEADEAQIRALKSSVAGSVARVYLNLGVLKTREGEPGRAARLFEQAEDLDADLPRLQYSLGVARFNAERFELATEPLSRALEKTPEDENLKQMLALAWLNSGEYENAADSLAELPARHSNAALQYAYGLALVRSGRAAQAESIFVRLLSDNADSPELNVVLGQAFAQQGDYVAAVDSLERAIALAPRVAEAHSTLGEIHMRKGELGEAEEALRTELGLHPDDSRAMFTLATVLDLNQKSQEAMSLLRALLDGEPYLAKARYLLGKILLTGGAAEEALEQFEAAVGLSPIDPNIRYQLGQAYQKLGRRDEARKEFDTFRELKNERRAGESR